MPPRTKRQTAPDVVGLDEIAAMLGVSKQRASQLMDRRLHDDAPEGKLLARGRVWSRLAVVKYARETLHRDVLEVPR